MSKKYMTLRREARLEVKTAKVKFSKNTTCSGHIWRFGNGKIPSIVALSTCPNQNVKCTECPDHFWRFRCGSAWQAQGNPDLAKSKWNKASVAIMSKNNSRHGACQEDLRRCGKKRDARDMFIRDVRRSGADFLRSVAFWCIRSSGLLDDLAWQSASTSYDFASLFLCRAQHFEEVEWKIALKYPFWRKSRRIASFLKLSTANWRSLAKLLQFWCCQVQKLRSRRIASFSIDGQKDR